MSNYELTQSLKESIDGFRYLNFDVFGADVRLRMAGFIDDRGTAFKFSLGELSDGKRCLIALYSLLHFVIKRGGIIILDEPDNFVSLREIQPWLTAVAESVEEGPAQVSPISHHPELINQWAPDCGVRFVRAGMGPTRANPFAGEPDSGLTPAELIARGWTND